MTGTLLIEDFQEEDDFVPFERLEFSGELLRRAKNPDGSLPSIGYLSGRRPVQYFSNCNPNERDRPLDPDDNRLDQIYRRWDIKRWTIVGDTSENADVNAFYSIARAHKILRQRFEAHQTKVRGDVSIDWLENVAQLEDFSYLQVTTLSMQGRCFGNSVTEINLLVKSFTPVVDFEIPNLDGTTSDILKGYQLVVERWVNKAASATTF